jgi:pyrroloquinoline quinone biosynthesis protein D
MSNSLSLAHCPRIRRGFRLQWEAAQNAHVLLYPEGMVKLNGSAGEILSRCSGSSTVDQIIIELERAFDGKALSTDIQQFLAYALERGWIEVQS